MPRLRPAFVLTSLLGVSVAACTLLTNLDGFSGGANSDVTDAALDRSELPNEASTLDTTTSSSDAGTGTDSADAAMMDVNVVPPFKYECPGGGKVTDCAMCPAGHYPCMLCGSSGADVSRQIGVCVTSPSSGSACEGKGPAGYDDCLCPGPGNPSPCPMPYQICPPQSGPACRTCGWDGGMGLTCKGGGVCSAAGVCQ